MNYLAIFDVFRKGEIIADPATWKTRSAITVAISALVVTIGHVLQGTKYDPHIDQGTADSIAGTVAFVASMFSTFATTDKIGLLSSKSVPAESGPTDLSGGA